MPPPRFRPKPKSHGASSLLRFLFPHTRQRAHAHLHKLRYESLPSFRRHAQARIYKYIVYRQAQKLRKKPGILQRLRGHTKRLLGPGYLENEVRLRRQKLNNTGGPEGTRPGKMSYQDGYGVREPGQRRRKLAGYLKAANELRQTYQQQYAGGFSRGPATYDYQDDANTDPTDAAVVRSGDEEMILFPSYARKHIKRKARRVALYILVESNSN